MRHRKPTSFRYYFTKFSYTGEICKNVTSINYIFTSLCLSYSLLPSFALFVYLSFSLKNSTSGLFSYIMHCQGRIQSEFYTGSLPKKMSQKQKVKFWKLTCLLLEKKFYETFQVFSIDNSFNSKGIV